MTATARTTPGDALTPDEIRHYSRHLLIPEIGTAGQRLLKGARVLLVGTGGLGSPAALYLAAAGVGTLGLVEFDDVDVSNLQRQVLYGVDDVGLPKIERAAARLAQMNPHIAIVQHPERLSSGSALEILAHYDVVVDGTDNFATRYLINDACVLLGKPNVHASVFRFEGQLSVFNHGDGPCYRCLYPDPPPPQFAVSCAEGGVFGVLPGVLGALQAAEVIKLIVGVGTPMSGRLMRWDAAAMSFREFSIRRDPQCPICGEQPTLHGLIDYEKFCGVNAGGETPASADAPRVVSPRWLAERIGSGEALQLVDVRSSTEFEIVRIAGARLMPLDELDAHLPSLDPRAPVVCYCKSGVRSSNAARRLLERGFADVVSLDGGILAWARDVDASAAVY